MTPSMSTPPLLQIYAVMHAAPTTTDLQCGSWPPGQSTCERASSARDSYKNFWRARMLRMRTAEREQQSDGESTGRGAECRLGGNATASRPARQRDVRD